MKTSLFLLFSRAMIAVIVAITFSQAVDAGGHGAAAVSYTHLTLPTKA